MKETVKMSRCAGYLEKIFRTLNNAFFAGELEEPIITIQSTPRAYGHVTVGRAWSRGQQGDTRRELNLDAASLSRPIEQLVATVLHECCHLYNLQHGIQDCSRGGTYHNRRFKATAESVGLHVAYSERYGWAHTSPTDELIEFVLDQGWNEILINRTPEFYTRGIGTGTASGNGDTLPPIRKGNSKKLICPCCGLTVRATRDGIRILCVDCEELLVYTE